MLEPRRGTMSRSTTALRRAGVALAVLPLAIGLAACGSDDTAARPPPSGAADELRLGYFANVTHAAALIGVAAGLLRRGARRDQADHAGLQRRPGRGRGAVRRRASTPPTSAPARPSTPTGRATGTRSGSSPAPPPAAPSSSSATASPRPPTSRARRSPARSSATPRTSRCAPGSPTQGLKNSVRRRRRRHRSRRRPTPTSSTCSSPASSTAPGCPSPGPRGWCSRAAATCWSTRRTCGRRASSSPRT